ncbi:aspartoacylase isoform X2 [Prionailurus iriomotensis]
MTRLVSTWPSTGCGPWGSCRDPTSPPRLGWPTGTPTAPSPATSSHKRPRPRGARANLDDPCKVTKARELNLLPGPQASGRAFGFVLDLHSSTANTGTCLIAEAAHRGSCHAPVPPPGSPKVPCPALYQLPGWGSYSLDPLAKNGMGRSWSWAPSLRVSCEQDEDPGGQSPGLHRLFTQGLPFLNVTGAWPGGEEIGKIAPPTGYRSARCHLGSLSH